jgi:putative transposase
MDGKGAWRDNVFVERLWRSVKYEEVYLRAYDSVSESAVDRWRDCGVKWSRSRRMRSDVSSSHGTA